MMEVEPAMSLASNLLHTAAAHADRVALRLGEAATTYRQLDHDSARVAGLLRDRGMQPGDRVGVMLPTPRNSPWSTTACCGVGFRNSDIMPRAGSTRERDRRVGPGAERGRRLLPHQASPNLDASGRPKRETSVRPLVVVVPHVLVEHSLKMASTPDQHPVQTLLSYCPDPAFGERVGVRRLDRGLDDLGAVGGEDVVEGAGETTVAIANEEPRGGRALRPLQ